MVACQYDRPFVLRKSVFQGFETFHLDQWMDLLSFLYAEPNELGDRSTEVFRGLPAYAFVLLE